mmetsp:Transcript_168114/g.539925  ORF Transcript_168114/g.539925 Transcript_168114/m.539925 type:complete len:699 (+) Transcript_168114:90-2186(+)
MRMAGPLGCVVLCLLPLLWQRADSAFPAAIPLITTDPYMQTWMMGDEATSGLVRHWDQRPKEMVGLLRVDGDTYRFIGDWADNNYVFQAMKQLSMEVQPSRTIFKFQDPASKVELDVTFLSTMFSHDYARLSRPVSYVVHEVRSIDGSKHDVDLYFDMTAQHVVNDERENVTWKDGILGTEAQNVLGERGDQMNINWGFLYLRDASAQGNTRLRGGSSTAHREAFGYTGALPKGEDARMPRACSDDLPALSLVRRLGALGADVQRHVLLVGYDDVKSVTYYNEGQFSGYWTQVWPNLEAALEAAAGEIDAMLAKSVAHDKDLMDKLTATGGPKYAAIGALAYRQTLAATKLVWNSKRKVMWNFLKEISTNGDMQTMDVIYPASPAFLYSNPELLKLLLIPVLSFANNETSTPFSDPFSPHEIGTYPIADHNTAQQERMPMENTGNMFLMLMGLSRAGTDMAFLKPYWKMLLVWADYLEESLPFPANQICTDDFEGGLANNTNLGAKGIVALEAFAELCGVMALGGDCAGYRASARDFAATWQKLAWEDDHYVIAFGMPGTYSIKYNVVWQKLLRLDGPFDWKTLGPPEVKYYISKKNKYGTPMDHRHTYVKLDWLSWAAAMADDDASFQAMHDPIYDQGQDTACRVPLTDLFDTVSASCAYGKEAFVARPVVGGVFAKMLTSKSWLAPVPSEAQVVYV